MTVDDIIRRYEGRNFTPSETAFFRNFCRCLRHFKKPEKLEHLSAILSGVLDDTITPIKVSGSLPGNDSPVLVTVVKDELVRMREFFRHYRRLGVEKFVILDNDSHDGTKEFCLSQDDADVFSVTHPFTSARHVSWVNKLLMLYGVGRWYLSVDADEILDYPDSEQHGVDSVVRAAEGLGLSRIAAVTVDFYPRAELFSFPGDSIRWEEACWFDTDSYKETESSHRRRIVGGPRKRVLNTYSALSKYPLFRLGAEDVFLSVHYLWPFGENFASDWFLVLKHYEFLNEEDRRKMTAIIERGNYATNSREYREMEAAMCGKSALSFWHNGSERYTSSESLRKIPFLSSIFGR